MERQWEREREAFLAEHERWRDPIPATRLPTEQPHRRVRTSFAVVLRRSVHKMISDVIAQLLRREATGLLQDKPSGLGLTGRGSQ